MAEHSFTAPYPLPNRCTVCLEVQVDMEFGTCGDCGCNGVCLACWEASDCCVAARQEEE